MRPSGRCQQCAISDCGTSTSSRSQTLRCLMRAPSLAWTWWNPVPCSSVVTGNEDGAHRDQAERDIARPQCPHTDTMQAGAVRRAGCYSALVTPSAGCTANPASNHRTSEISRHLLARLEDLGPGPIRSPHAPARRSCQGRPLSPWRRVEGSRCQGLGDAVQVRGHGATRRVGPVVAAFVVEVVGAGPGAEVPVRPGLARDGVPQVATPATRL